MKFIKFKTFGLQKIFLREWKAIDLENIYSNHISGKGFVKRIHKEFLKLSNKKTNNQIFKNGQKIRIYTSLKWSIKMTLFYWMGKIVTLLLRNFADTTITKWPRLTSPVMSPLYFLKKIKYVRRKIIKTVIDVFLYSWENCRQIISSFIIFYIFKVSNTEYVLILLSDKINM